MEAIEMGKLVRRGAMAKMDQFVATVFKNDETDGDTSTEECG